MKGEQRSVVMLTGYIQNEIKPKAGTARFSLGNQEGVFYVSVHSEVLARQCEQLQLGDKVMVVGYLSAFFNENCRGHHTTLNLQAISPALEEPWLVGGIPFMVSRMYSGVFQHLEQDEGQVPASAAMITGRVNSPIQAREGGVHFSLGNGDGVFHIRTEGRLGAFCNQLRAGDTVVLSGYLGSHPDPVCRNQHVWLEPLIVIPTASVWDEVWEVIGVPLSMMLMLHALESE